MVESRNKYKVTERLKTKNQISDRKSYFFMFSKTLFPYPIQAMVMESTCFVVLIVCERLAITKFNFSKTRFLMPLNASILSCLVVWCYKETGAMINPALALSMNIFVWHKEPFTHFLVYWIFPWSVVHMVSLYQVGRTGTVGHKKMVTRIKKDKQGRGKL